jgi:hypothetical protein
VKEEPNILHRIKRSYSNWIGHILHKNCLPKPVIEGNIEGRIEVTGIRGSRRISYWMIFRKREDVPV